jgi:AcrR family transcriptional regulator
MYEPDRPAARRKLSRARILEAALRVADEEGLDALSMRHLGQALEVQAMSLYKHIADKEDILDGISDLVMLEVEVPARALPWRDALRQSATSMHHALLRHPWASVVIESRRNPGPARLRYLDTVVAILLDAGFSIDDVGRAGLAVDSHVYGFTLQVAAMPFDIREEPEQAESIAATFGETYPSLRAMAEHAATEAGFPIEFDFGLEMILDGLERRLAATRAAGANPKRRGKR